MLPKASQFRGFERPEPAVLHALSNAVHSAGEDELADDQPKNSHGSDARERHKMPISSAFWDGGAERERDCFTETQ
jgi:hypothetical protein